ITKIEGLDNCTSLRTLCLNENCIREVAGLSALRDLRVLNLSNNFISDLSGLDGCCPLLEVLHLAANQLSDESAAVLAKFNYLSVLDISSNKFAAEETIDLLQQIQTLKVLYIHRNPLVSRMQNYRRKLIMKLQHLSFLDEHPVKDEDRLIAAAFFEGGLQKEKEEREKINKQKHDKRLQCIR
ncbi:leucine rich repeat protein, putative, partial [Eimeria acervulina]